MKRTLTLATLALATLALSHAQQSALPGDPFSIRKTWQIGGDGTWGALAIDPAAQQLFIAHGPVLQVVDLETGTLTTQIPVQGSPVPDTPNPEDQPLNEAHGIALDPSGQYGFVTVGRNGSLQVFNRSTLSIVARVPTPPFPQAVVYEPETQLLFVLCTPPATTAPSRLPHPPISQPLVKSQISVFETTHWTRLGDILVRGSLGAALADSRGHLFINITDQASILTFDAAIIQSALQHQPPQTTTAQPVLDWTSQSPSLEGHPSILHTGCAKSSGMALDPLHDRLFLACSNQKLAVLNSATGASVATLSLSPGTNALAFDPEHALLFAATGNALGTLTIFRQDVNDTYSLIQTLPTQPRANTLAVNPSTGTVYLVADITGFDLSHPAAPRKPAALPVINASPVQDSFRVLVVGQ